ncbi:MAG: T9SS type A sorting domain-containing protein [Lewinellaceae bacterium]|nr:T9SS type A sorting domain-containing protein [Lewinellaceae bacterium]
MPVRGLPPISGRTGSANPTFAASDIGIYWVEVTDACGNKQRDSVLLTVNLLPDTQFPDEVLCAGDSLALSLPGFDTYAWSPASGLSCADCPDVVLFPGATTTYTLLATTSDGCVLRDTFTVEVFPIPSVAINLSFCPGESVTIDGVTYTQSGTVSSVIPAPNGCDTLATYMLTLLPQPSVTKTISFCPGESVTIDGVTYTQPGTVSGVIPAATGCDTLATYVLKFATPAPSQVDISCPPDVDIAISPGAGPTVATYNLPSASSDCSCPGLTLQLVSGLPSGSAFPPGATKVCYQAKDACGNTASCCFEVMIREEQPCDIKKTGCMKYELLSITKDAAGKRTYTIRVTNSCPNPLTYTAIQLPDGVIAKAPANNSVYTAPGGRKYDVRNPNYSPFYSIRFKSTTDSIANGESDIFEYVLPPQAQPAYIHITSRLEPQQFYEAHLNTYYCPVGVTPVPKVEARFVPESTAGLNVLFPNPTTGSLYADLSNRAGESVQIQIFDSRGQRVQWFETTAETTVQEFHLPESIANGLYFFEITGGSGSRQTTRFVLQR